MVFVFFAVDSISRVLGLEAFSAGCCVYGAWPS